jgi:hypothetical protein
MGQQRHVILRQTVELAIARESEAWPLQEEASRILRRALPLIERCCDDLSAPDRLYRIERLELDLGRLDRRRLEEDLLARLGEALRGALAEQISRQDHAELPPKIASQRELLALFVREGHLPWWADPQQADQPKTSLAALLRESPGLLHPLLREWADDPKALRRLAGHFEDRALADLAGLGVPALERFILPLVEALLSLSDHPEALPPPAPAPARLRGLVWQSLLANAADAPQPGASLPDFGRGVLTRLAHRLALPYPTLVRGLGLAAESGRFPAELRDMAAALDAEMAAERSASPEDGAAPATLPPGEEGPRNDAAPSARPAGIAPALETLRRWLAEGEEVPAPPWLRAFTPILREEFVGALRDMGGSAAAALEAVRFWLEGEPRGPVPPWLEAWPPPLREALAARLGEVSELRETSARPTRSADADAIRRPEAKTRNRPGFSDAEEIHLGNAGLVILWPFLAHFFDRLELLRESRFVDEVARQRAVALLQCLAAGDADPPEYRLPLNKLLCGLPLDAVFELDSPLAEAEIAECEHFLEAVIAQAPILNAMSIGGFRGSFLLRAGILEVRDGAWLLRVERETYDLVLDRFPWGFQWVKLPWMEFPLQVEW